MPNKLVVLAVICCVCVSGEQSENSLFSSAEDIKEAFSNCDGKNVIPCLKMRTLNYIDRLEMSEEVSVVDGIYLEKSPRQAGARRLDESVADLDEKQLPNDPLERDEALDELLIEKLARFLTTHSVKFRVPKYIEGFFNEDKETGRGKDKGGELMMVGSMLVGKMGMLAIKGLGLLTGMALIAAKIALAAATALGLSKLLHKGSEKTTVEIVKHPKVSHGHSHSHEISHHHHGDDYRRSMGEADDSHLLAYNAQVPQQSDAAAAVSSSSTTPHLGVATNGDLYYYYE